MATDSIVEGTITESEEDFVIPFQLMYLGIVATLIKGSCEKLPLSHCLCVCVFVDQWLVGI